MVKLLRRLIPWLMLVWTWAAAAASLEVRVEPKTLAMGEPLSAEIRASGLGARLDESIIAPWRRDFEVYTASTSTTEQRGRSTQVMSVTLYPLRSGELSLAPLALAGKTSRAVPVRVETSGPDVPRVVTRAYLDRIHPTVREAVLLTLDLYDDGSLQWSPPGELRAPDMHLRYLGERQAQATLEGAAYTVHRYLWALTPLRDGSLEVKFPTLAAVKFGKRLRYPAPAVGFRASPVPAYLPVHVPVGKVSLAPGPLPAGWVVGRPVNWTFTVSGAGITAEGLSRLLADMPDRAGLHAYAAQVSGRPATPGDAAAAQTFDVTIPVTPLAGGEIRLPDVRLPYFDQAAGRIVLAQLTGAPVEVVDPVRQRIIAASLLLGGTLLAGMLVYIGMRRWKRMRIRHAALAQVRAADSAEALTRALLAFDDGHGAPGGTTLGQWLVRLEDRMGAPEQLTRLVEVLEAGRYGAVKLPDIVALRAAFAQALARMRPKRAGAEKLIASSPKACNTLDITYP
ncbi:MAG: BatD family protein [Betaproteobacteria bacterium]|nr:BatD family protein [Betaproteobacteria bacterium]